ncbi:MAG: biotin/lipoyl-binding protein [Limnochordia bacterium]|nr:biotin/lipoyl-binding protein [Bacillota bacterium]HQE35880.1 biotin/lipoyl-binding protein [Limnochordia bacterium]
MRQPTMPVSRGTLRKTISASGAIRGARQADLGFTAGARIERILVEVGQTVAEGELLAEMDSTQQELALLRPQKAYELTGASGSQAGSGYSPQL